MVPFVKPAIVIGETVPLLVLFSGLDVTIYPVIGLPPFEEGALKITVAWEFPGKAVTLIGTPGTVNNKQGTPGQFSNAAFFHLTLSSSRLNPVLE